ncbi:hypothetical protein HY625_03050 [Candidatus Uhrbacteria bacterium]|nr:hypothetical protein [Candidatus Uhrbacteria bacterium]
MDFYKKFGRIWETSFLASAAALVGVAVLLAGYALFFGAFWTEAVLSLPYQFVGFLAIFLVARKRLDHAAARWWFKRSFGFPVPVRGTEEWKKLAIYGVDSHLCRLAGLSYEKFRFQEMFRKFECSFEIQELAREEARRAKEDFWRAFNIAEAMGMPLRYWVGGKETIRFVIARDAKSIVCKASVETYQAVISPEFLGMIFWEEKK